IAEYALSEKLPARIREWLAAYEMPETPKADDPAFARSHFHLLLGVDDLFHPAHTAAAAAGFVPQWDNSTDDWAVRRSAEYLLGELQNLQVENPGRRVALIADGEVSSPVTGNGTGGRNAAFVLACVEKIADRKIAVLSAGTDGIDGNSPAAGAAADGQTLKRARKAGMDPETFFHESNAYTFFSKLDDAVITGPTGNNLRDLRILLSDA